METKRRPRRHRSRNPLTKRIYLGELDYKILRYLTRYRYLTAELLTGLLGYDSKQYITRRLRSLMDHHYIQQYNDTEDSLPLKWPNFFMIDEKGESALIEDGDEPHHFLHVARKIDSDVRQNFKHDFQASRVLASIEIGLKAAGRQIKYQYEITKGASIKLPCRISHRHEDGTKEEFDDKYNADGLIGWQEPDGAFKYFSYEEERGNPLEFHTLKKPSTLKKVIALRDIQKKRTYDKQWHISNLRTLFAYKSADRAQHAADLAERVIGETNQFLFTSIDKTKTGIIPDILNRRWLQAGYSPTPLIQKKTPKK